MTYNPTAPVLWVPPIRSGNTNSENYEVEDLNGRTQGCRWHFGPLLPLAHCFYCVWLTLSAHSGSSYKRISDFSADILFLSVPLLFSNQIAYLLQYSRIFKAVKHYLKLEIGSALIKAVRQRGPI
jgi:hypothetical protein